MQFLRKAIFCLFVILPFLYANAQQFGGNPPSVKWKQINTDTVRVIFPDGLQRRASEIASIAHQLGATQSTLGNKLRKVSIVLQNQTTVANGYVGLGPYRSEFYMTPTPNSFELGSLPWHQQLALHEYRHVQQFNNFRKGVSQLFYVLAGELGVSFANNTALPNWFWEGDAVYQETLKSKQGRGRLPHFYNGYRSLWAAQKNYSWLKLRNGSLRDYVPDHYQLGYLLSAYGREKYGDDIWAQVTDDAVRFRGLFYPFQSAIKTRTGKTYEQFRTEAMNFFRNDMAKAPDSAAKWAAGKKHFAGNKEYPQWISNDQLIYVKSSYKQIPAFYTENISTGEQKKIRVRDIAADNYFSYRNGHIVYAAYDVDLRWGWRDYGDIRLLNISTGEQKQITRKTKYFAPDISADGRSIVAMHIGSQGESSLHILSTDSGKTQQVITVPDGQLYTYPKFYGNDQVVTAVRNEKGEMSLGLVSIGNGHVEWLLPFSMNVIGLPNVKGDTILFTASFQKRDQLFAAIGKKIYLIESGFNRQTGSYSPALQNGQLAWNDFTAAGTMINVATLASHMLVPQDKAAFETALPDFGISSLQSGGPLPDPRLHSNFPVTKYSKAHRLFKVHSWIPNISDPEYIISILSENVLNTQSSELYFNYNANEKSKKLGFTGAYGALYPWLRLGTAYTRDRSFNYSGAVVRFDEWEARGGVLVPLNLLRGRTYNNLSVGTDYVYAKPENFGKYKDTFDTRGYGYVHSYLNFSSQSQRARQHIFPRFGQVLRVEFKKAVTSASGNQLLANGQFYLPGLHVNHNLVLNLAMHRRDTLRNIIFSNSFPFSRGYSDRNFHQMYKLGMNYHLPLLYPDWGFASIVYFLRVRANAFFDMTRIKDYNAGRQLVSRDFNSYGAELYFDTKWWNQHPVSFGFRYSRLLNGELQGLGPNQFEFILPVNLIGR